VLSFHGQVDWEIDEQHPAKATETQVIQNGDGGFLLFKEIISTRAAYSCVGDGIFINHHPP
jgi:hypothetical protein